jgi:hypothetical protein
MFAFTTPSIQVQSYYPSLLNRIKNGDSCLDLGCGLGQNVHKISLDCSPSSNTFGSDLSQDLVDCGYDYFRDQEALASKFFIGDLLDENSSGLQTSGKNIRHPLHSLSLPPLELGKPIESIHRFNQAPKTRNRFRNLWMTNWCLASKGDNPKFERESSRAYDYVSARQGELEETVGFSW